MVRSLYCFLGCMVVVLFLCIFPCSVFSAETAESDDAGTMIPKDQLSAILLHIEENMGQIKSLKTKIVQEKMIALFSEPVFSNGILLFKSPGKIRLEYFDPFKSVLLVNENKISKYEIVKGQWKKIGSGDEKMMQVIMDHIGAWIKGRFNENDLYTVSGQSRTVEGQTCYAVLLEPKSESFKSFISGFELGINEKMDRLDYIIIKESGDDYTKLTFRDDRINTGVEDRYFTGDSRTFPAVPKW